LKALIVVNNFVHDLFTGLWASSLLVIVLLNRKAKVPDSALVADSLHAVMRIFFWIGVASIAVIVVSGSLRMLYYRSGISAEDEKIKKELLIVKHVFFTFAFIGGTYLAYVYAFS
jgi:putative copper export protein